MLAMRFATVIAIRVSRSELYGRRMAAFFFNCTGFNCVLGVYRLKNETDADVMGLASARDLTTKQDDELMLVCDELFSALTSDAHINQSAGVVRRPDTEGDGQERERFFKRMRQRPKTFAHQAVLRAGKKSALSVGVDGRVYVGFDSEWEEVSKGKNRILSVQFFVVGPTGETFSKVIHVVGIHNDGARPRLGQTIYDLLEEAWDLGVIEAWPADVVLCGFFTRADITVFLDFKDFRSGLMGVGGTLATVGDPFSLELPMAEQRQQELKSRYSYVLGPKYDPKLLRVQLVDASRLAPPGKSLAYLGKMLGLPKIELPAGYGKKDMAAFQRKERQKFEAYGVRDAEIAVKYVLWVVWFSTRYLGLDMSHLSATASGIAVRVAEACVRGNGVSLNVALNFEDTRVTRWDNKKNRAIAQKQRAPTAIRRWLESFLADAYSGGRNECYVYGPTAVRKFFDPDLSGAYLTGLVYLFTLDYDRARQSSNIEDYMGHVAGFAQVEFEFPVDTGFPCLPVSVDGRGLLFPLKGLSICTAPEIELARQMGAHVVIKFGYVIPWMAREEVFARSSASASTRESKKISLNMSPESTGAERGAECNDAVEDEGNSVQTQSEGDIGYRLFESFAVRIRELRKPYQRKTLPFEFVKLLGNSLYGKTGQGYKGKRAFGPREMGSVVVGQSRVSDVAVAALVCGFIRAVIGEILWKLPAESTVVSATTDGFLVDQPIDALDLSGIACQRFQSLVDRVSPGSHMLENKHQVMQLFAGRTRLQFTTLADGGHPTVTAKGGVKPGPLVEDENAYMLDLVLNRQPGQKLEYESFISMRDQLTLGYDLQMERHEVTLNMEYDFKRRPVSNSVRMVEIAGSSVSHLAFDTEPYSTVDEAIWDRLIFDQWRKSNCLKTIDDFRNWESFRLFNMGKQKRANSAPINGGVVKSARSATGRKNATKSGYVGIAKRVFLAAYQKRMWGLEGADMSQRDLSTWLTEMGYKTSVTAVKNGTGDQPAEHVVPGDADVLKFLEVLKQRFPGLEVERFLISED